MGRGRSQTGKRKRNVEGERAMERDRQGAEALDRARRERDRRRDAEVVELPELGPADMMARVTGRGEDDGVRRTGAPPPATTGRRA